jgi:hypothetical protein
MVPTNLWLWRFLYNSIDRCTSILKREKVIKVSSDLNCQVDKEL